MKEWQKECKRLNTGLIGYAVTNGIRRETRRKITKAGDSALRFLVDPLGSDKKRKKNNGQTIHVHVHQNRSR